MILNNGDIYIGNWKNDLMSDDDAIYIFKNGNEYRGGFKSNNSYQFDKYGYFEGNSTFIVPKKGIFTGKF